MNVREHVVRRYRDTAGGIPAQGTGERLFDGRCPEHAVIARARDRDANTAIGFGNEHTDETLIRRIMGVKIGDPLDMDGMDAAWDALEDCGHFRFVEMDYDDDQGENSGAAYVFHFDGTTWAQQAKLTAADAAADDYFGHSVALSGDTAVVGA